MMQIETHFKGKRTLNSYVEMENLSPELRQCVHEYGLPIVIACRNCGVTDPRRIHLLVAEIWAGARQPGQRQETAGTLDWILLQAGAEISAATLIRVLRNNHYTITPLFPTREMIAASMAEVSGFNKRVTKQEKHRLRLAAALQRAAETIWRKGDIERAA